MLGNYVEMHWRARFHFAGKEARIRLPDKVCRRAAGSGTSVNQHLPAGFKGSRVLNADAGRAEQFSESKLF